nr:serine/threonine protein kinase [Streptomyces sp. ODS25]
MHTPQGADTPYPGVPNPGAMASAGNTPHTPPPPGPVQPSTGSDRAARQAGPYTVITRLDDRAFAAAVPERRFIARSVDGERTMLVSTPLDGADPQAFMIEAEAARYHLGTWALPTTEVAGPGEEPWHARPYLPVLPLPTALRVHGGPLPEHTVRAVGLALAETLHIGHGQNLTHAGVSPSAVLLAADGPRLGCFGSVRAAAPDGTSRTGLRGLDSGTLPPEQAAGGRPRPLGDVYALGATLAYASTGHTNPDPDALPPALRPVILKCLSQDPTNRPMPRELLDVLASAAETPSAQAGAVPHGATVLDPHATTAGRATALLGPGWLPARVVAALAHQSAAVLAAEIPVTAQPQQAWPPPSASGGIPQAASSQPGQGPASTPPPPTPAHQMPPYGTPPQATPAQRQY